ncbi:MAG TPA: hypothetical protein VGK16_08175 [Candidatus Limnocylindrales bacterium]
MNTGTLVWLVVLAALGILFLLTVRRLSVLMGRTRDLERYQKLVRQLDRRFAEVADPFVNQLDEIRRRSGDPRALGATLPAVQEMLGAISGEAQSASVPRGLAREAGAFTMELERAVRAGELVGHGLDALLADRGGRDLEAQTSLKRGALNLRHARDAASRLAAEIVAVRPADLLDRADTALRGAAGPALPTYFVDDDVDEGR